MKLSPTVLFAFLALFPAVSVRADQPDEEVVKSAQMRYLRGILLERRGAYAESLQAYEEALSFDPGSAYIGREAADLALEMGQVDKAAKLAARVLELEPKSAQSHILMGRVHWARGDVSAAQAAFEAALKIDPRSAESIFSLGSLLSARDPEKARSLLEGFLQENPSQAADAHFQIAKLDLQAGRVGEAEDHLKAAIALDPDYDSLPMRYALAQAYESKRSTDSALGEYLEILKLEPHNIALLNHIGQLHFIKGDWEEASRRFEAAKSLQSDDPTANHWLAIYSEKQGDFAKAAGYLKASLALKEDPALALRLSYYLTQAGKLQEAVEVLEAAYGRWPSNDQIAYFLALGYDDLKEGSKAVRILRKLLALKPDYRDARYQLAVVLEKTGDMAGAEKEFRALLSRKPDDASVLNYLGYSLADRGLKLDEAEALIRGAVRLEPKNGAYLDSLGWVHFKQGRSTEAVSELLDSLAILPDDENVWDHLGDAYSVAGSPPSAWFAWMKAQSLTPSESRNPKKAASIQARFSSEDLGGYYLDYLKVLQGGIQKLSGLCEIKGEILGKPFDYSGIVTFKAPQELSIDILGPLFTPILRVRLNQEGFAMDPLHIEGLDPDAIADSARASFSFIRDYLSGAPFRLRPARYRKGWRNSEVEVPGWRLSLSPDGLLAQALWPESRPGYRVVLEDFGRYKGRQVPRSIRVVGKDFSLGLQFNNVNIDLQAEAPGP